MPIRGHPSALPLTADFRLGTVRIALAVSWAAFGAFVGTHRSGTGAVIAIAVGAAALVGLTALPWRSLLREDRADPILFVWASLALTGAAFPGEIGIEAISPVAPVVVAVLAGLLLPRWAATAIAMLACLAVVSPDLLAGRPPEPASALTITALLAAAIAAGMVAEQSADEGRREALRMGRFRRRMEALSRRLAELETALEVVATATGDPAACIGETLMRIGESAGIGNLALIRNGQQGLIPVEPALVDGRLSRHTPSAIGDLAREYGSGGPVRERETIHEHDEMLLLPFSSAAGDGGYLVAGPSSGPLVDRDRDNLAGLIERVEGVLAQTLALSDARDAAGQMERWARFRADYASVVSHELRTPLTSIIGVLQTVSRPELAPEHPDARELLEIGVSQADHLRTLVEDLLVVSRIDSDSVPVRPDLADVAALIDSAVERVAGAADLVEVVLEPDLPRVLLDPDHTRRTMVNLLENAVKHGDGSPIDIRAEVDDHELVITVADHGPGLAGEDPGRAFLPFAQLQRSETNGRGGIGLGLSICQGLVQAMQGTLSHRDTEGGGATFEIRLPFRPHREPPRKDA